MDLQPGDLTTLDKLPVGSVGEYLDNNERFIVVKNDSYPWVGIGYADGGRSVKISSLEVRYHGPGRIEPARIVLDSEPDRIAELEAQVRALREAIAQAAIPLEGLRASVDWELAPAVKSAIQHACEKIRSVLSATAPSVN